MAEYPILVVADHKWRDLPGMALLKTILEEQYHLPTLIVGYGSVGACLRYFRPRALVMTTLIGPRERKMARAAHAIGSPVIIIPVDPGSRESMPALLGKPSDWEACDLYLAWGAFMENLVVAGGYVPKEKMKVTGSGRFDFYQPPLRRHLLPPGELAGQYGLRANCPVVTWATTFVMAGYGDDERILKHNEKDYESRGLSHRPGFADLRVLVERDQRARSSVLKWMRQACVEFPHAEFILKPHPYEPTAPYEQLWKECLRDGIGNMHLCTRDYIWNLLNGSALLIHTGSTTGAEAWLMNVPTVFLQPDGHARFKAARGSTSLAIEALEDVQENMAGLRDRLTYYLSGGKLSDALIQRRNTYLEEWFYFLDGRASERQAAAIANLLNSGQHKHNPLLSPPWVGLRTPLRLLQYHFNALLGREFDELFFEDRQVIPKDFLGQEDKVVRQRDVRAWTERVREALVISGTLVKGRGGK